MKRRTIEVADNLEIDGYTDDSFSLAVYDPRHGAVSLTRHDLEKLRDAITQLLEEDKQ